MRPHISSLAFFTILVSIASPTSVVAQDATTEAELESQAQLDRMRHAPAPPLPPMPIYSEVESRSPAHRALVGHDLATGETTVFEVGAAAASDDRAPARSASRPAVLPRPLAALPVAPLLEVLDSPEGTDGLATKGSCTPPAPYLFTHDFPFTTTYKLLMRFVSGGSDYFYVCSAASMGSFHLLTAGHCLYNHDPNDDGNTADAAWASEVWAWAAQTDLVNPFFGAAGDADRPYGFAKATFLRSYTGWTASGDLNHDLGYVTLDRRDGDHTGWMGREAGVTTSALNFNGYPAETPFVPPGEIRQYPGFDAGNIDFYSTYRIRMCAFTYGGHSGGPTWRYDGADRFVQGVNSTSDRAGTAEATRITSAKFDDIDTVIAEDETARPPVARPDLAELLFTTVDDRKDLLVNSVAQGDSFQVEYSALNAGFANTGTLTIDFYLSTNAIISTGDTLIGTVVWSDLAAFTFLNPLVTLTANVAPGTYYVGWIMRSAAAEYGGDQSCTGTPCTNVAVIADETLTVSVSTCTPDGFEPDDSSGQASAIVSGVTQSHNICAIGDEDWAVFTLGATVGGWEIELSTSGAGADDTRMWLYDGAVTQLEFDDDGGSGLFSRIDRTCGSDPLPAGTYYVRVDEFGDDDEIDSYFLDLTVSSCDQLFADGFESGDTSVWSVSVP